MLRRWLRKWLFAEELTKLEELESIIELLKRSYKNSDNLNEITRQTLDTTKEVLEHNKQLIRDKEEILNKYNEILTKLDSNRE